MRRQWNMPRSKTLSLFIALCVSVSLSPASNGHDVIVRADRFVWGSLRDDYATSRNHELKQPSRRLALSSINDQRCDAAIDMVPDAGQYKQEMIGIRIMNENSAHWQQQWEDQTIIFGITATVNTVSSRRDKKRFSGWLALLNMIICLFQKLNMGHETKPALPFCSFSFLPQI